MSFDWGAIWPYRDQLLAGIGVTIALAVVTMLIAIPLGIIVMLMRISGIKPLAWIATVFVEIFRNTPLLLLVYWAYYAVPQITHLSVSALVTGVVALVLNTAAYNSENFRAGVNSIRKGQMEAGLSLGMSWGEAMRKIVLPQAIRRIVPVLASSWVSLFKATSLVSAIGVYELAHVALEIRAENYRVLETLTTLALIYWVLAYPQAKLVDWLNRKYGAME
ncbi:MAG TPA: amino acid ABC transporter permease [Devosia sp.]|jgi:polar amino acid transport system permease protein|nr:amino acid ABC transporter permease [Devosia sp.]